MALRNIQIDIPRKNILVEIQLEETIQIKALLLRLKHEGYLNSDKTYFAKFENGKIISQSALAKTWPDSIVITEDEHWKPVISWSLSQMEAPEISDGIARNNSIYWLFPMFKNHLSYEANTHYHLFEIEDISITQEESLQFFVFVQYVILDQAISGNHHSYEFLVKMKQIISNTIQVEFTTSSLMENNFLNHIDDLTDKIKRYLTSHTELAWNAKINSVSLLGVK